MPQLPVSFMASAIDKLPGPHQTSGATARTSSADAGLDLGFVLKRLLRSFAVSCRKSKSAVVVVFRLVLKSEINRKEFYE